MKLFKKIALILLIILILLFALAAWYKNTFSMDPVTGYTINSVEMPKKILIGTQGSQFKDYITKGIVDEYREDSVFIKVIDVLKIEQENIPDFDVIVLMHTWENWEPPKEVGNFVSNLGEEGLKKTVVLTTSGQGDFRMDEVDALTGESDLEKTQVYIEQMVAQIETILHSTN